MPVKIIDFRSEESQSSTQHIHIQCLTIHSSSAPRRHHSTHTQQGRESSTAAYLVSQNIYLGDSQQGEGCPLVMLSLCIMWCFSLTSANEQERDWGRYRAHSTNRDRHRHKHNTQHSISSSVFYTYKTNTEKVQRLGLHNRPTRWRYRCCVRKDYKACNLETSLLRPIRTRYYVIQYII